MNFLFEISKHNIILFYVFIMFLSGLSFLYLLTKWNKIPLKFFLIHFFIVNWSGLMYLNILFDTPLIKYAFYCDWIISTPLIILALSLSAMTRTVTNWSLISALMGLQMITIITGALGHSRELVSKYTFFILGCIAMLGMFYILVKPLSKIAKSSSLIVFEKYKILASFVVVFWVLYPIVWILGTPGNGIISDFYTTLLFVILPIACKSGFGFLDLYLLRDVYNS